MQTKLQIEFNDVAVNPVIRAAIERHVTQLEGLFGRITSCRVAVYGPGSRHKNGGPNEVRIHLALPGGREVNVTRTPDADERQSDLAFAVDDAFRRARRQLRDQAGLLVDETKKR